MVSRIRPSRPVSRQFTPLFVFIAQWARQFPTQLADFSSHDVLLSKAVTALSAMEEEKKKKNAGSSTTTTVLPWSNLPYYHLRPYSAMQDSLFLYTGRFFPQAHHTRTSMDILPLARRRCVCVRGEIQVSRRTQSTAKPSQAKPPLIGQHYPVARDVQSTHGQNKFICVTCSTTRVMIFHMIAAGDDSSRCCHIIYSCETQPNKWPKLGIPIRSVRVQGRWSMACVVVMTNYGTIPPPDGGT